MVSTMTAKEKKKKEHHKLADPSVSPEIEHFVEQRKTPKYLRMFRHTGSRSLELNRQLCCQWKTPKMLLISTSSFSMEN